MSDHSGRSSLRDAGPSASAHVDASQTGSGGTGGIGPKDASAGGTNSGTGGTPSALGTGGAPNNPTMTCGPLECSDASTCPPFQWPALHCDATAPKPLDVLISVGCGYISVLFGDIIWTQEVYDQSGVLVARRGYLGGQNSNGTLPFGCQDSRSDTRNTKITPDNKLTLECPGSYTCHVCSYGRGPAGAYWCVYDDGSGSFPFYPPDGGAPR